MGSCRPPTVPDASTSTQPRPPAEIARGGTPRRATISTSTAPSSVTPSSSGGRRGGARTISTSSASRAGSRAATSSSSVPAPRRPDAGAPGRVHASSRRTCPAGCCARPRNSTPAPARHCRSCSATRADCRSRTPPSTSSSRPSAPFRSSPTPRPSCGNWRASRAQAGLSRSRRRTPSAGACPMCPTPPG